MTKSCGNCKYFEPINEDHGHCIYPVPAWLLIELPKEHPDHNHTIMPSRYAPCDTWAPLPEPPNENES